MSPFLAALVLAAGACAPTTRALPLAPTPVVAEPEELGEDPEILDEEVVSTGNELLGSIEYDLPLEANTWVEAELNYLVGQRPAVIGRWMERGDFYEPFIKSVLADEGMPTDLFHLAMIESGFVPSARSRAGAVGLWQFMPATGRLEGLRVDDVVDERLDPVRSTYAAIRHLRWLHRRFNGDWALAAAAYNAGAGRISRGMQGYGAENFWDLAVWGDLAEETKHYVPRLYAMTIIARDRPRFGFAERSPERPGFAFDSVKVDLPTPLAELSEIGGVELEELARLNPHLLHRVTPSGTYWVWVPAGTGQGVQQAFLDSEFRRGGGFATYVVKRGDDLGKLAARTGIPSARLRELNPRTNWDRLSAGQRLRVPGSAARTLAVQPAAPAKPASPPKQTSSVAANTQRQGSSSAGASRSQTASRAASPAPSAARTTKATQHTVKPGETLWSIAQRYSVDVNKIREANGLKSATIVVGRTLTIPQAVTASAARPTQVASAQPAQAKKPAPKTSQHVVKAGETLWSIAREYGASVDSIQVANRMAGEDVIVPGQRLLIPR